MHQLFEFVRLGHEIGLAVHFHQHANLAAHVDVAIHDAFGGDAALLLSGGGQTLFAQEVDGLVHIAARFLQRALAVHHAGARALAQLFNNFCTDFHRNTPSV